MDPTLSEHQAFGLCHQRFENRIHSSGVVSVGKLIARSTRKASIASSFHPKRLALRDVCPRDYHKPAWSEGKHTSQARRGPPPISAFVAPQRAAGYLFL